MKLKENLEKIKDAGLTLKGLFIETPLEETQNSCETCTKKVTTQKISAEEALNNRCGCNVSARTEVFYADGTKIPHLNHFINNYLQYLQLLEKPSTGGYVQTSKLILTLEKTLIDTRRIQPAASNWGDLTEERNQTKFKEIKTRNLKPDIREVIHYYRRDLHPLENKTAAKIRREVKQQELSLADLGNYCLSNSLIYALNPESPLVEIPTVILERGCSRRHLKKDTSKVVKLQKPLTNEQKEIASSLYHPGDTGPYGNVTAVYETALTISS